MLLSVLWLTSNELIDLLADSEDWNEVNQLRQIQEKETLYMGDISNPTAKKLFLFINRLVSSILISFLYS